MSFIPYGRHLIDDDDIAAVVEVLKSDWLTTGPKVDEFERALADFCGVKQCVALSSGTAALHAAMHAIGVGPGDEVIVSTLSFAASANCVVYQGARPVFADVKEEDLLIDPEDVERKITVKTKAIIAVDYAGLPCDYDRLREIATRNKLYLIADACHALGGSYKDRPVGSLADITTFSFHPVKNLTTGEGGAVATDNEEFASRIRQFRNHGISLDFRQRQARKTWAYEMVDLGWNYRLTDFQCALGLSQLKKLPQWIRARNAIAAWYDNLFEPFSDAIRIVHPRKTIDQGKRVHGRHLYVIRVPPEKREKAFCDLREAGVGANVHYIPIHMHPFYRRQYGTCDGMCPVSERAFRELLTLPLFPRLAFEEVRRIASTVLLSLEISYAPDRLAETASTMDKSASKNE